MLPTLSSAIQRTVVVPSLLTLRLAVARVDLGAVGDASLPLIVGALPSVV